MCIEKTAAVEPDCHLQQAVLYCHKHKINPKTATPDHRPQLFAKKLVWAWQRKTAEHYRDLEWANRILAEVEERRRANAKALEALVSTLIHNISHLGNHHPELHYRQCREGACML